MVEWIFTLFKLAVLKLTFRIMVWENITNPYFCYKTLLHEGALFHESVTLAQDIFIRRHF